MISLNESFDSEIVDLLHTEQNVLKMQFRPSPLDILGVSVTPFKSYDHVVDCVVRLIKARVKVFCIAINPENITYANKNKELK